MATAWAAIPLQKRLGTEGLDGLLPEVAEPAVASEGAGLSLSMPGRRRTTALLRTVAHFSGIC